MPEYGTYTRHADEFQLKNPPKLTKAGLKMLIEIWKAMGEPTEYGINNHMVGFDELKSHVLRPRSAGQVRQHLAEGGYLDFETGTAFNPDGMMELYSTALSERGFEALKERGIIK